MTIGDSAVNFDTVLDGIDSAIDKVNSERAKLGATQSRFDAVIGNLQIGIENQSAARGRIMDADFATETANLSRAQVLQQAGSAMIAQANQLPQQVLSLLR
jgi:flagellin